MSILDNIFNRGKKPQRMVRPSPVKKKGTFLINSDTRPAQTIDITRDTDKLNLGGLNHYVNSTDLENIAKYSDIVYLTFYKLKSEMFREGFDHEALIENPNILQKERIEEFVLKCNENGQTLKEVFEELEDDVNTYDIMFGLLLKKYEFNNKNEILNGHVNEFIRLNPRTVEIMHDKLQRIGRDEDGKPLYVSIKDRSKLSYEPYDSNGVQNLRACYKVIGENSDLYYDMTEIIHCSKYKPSKLYGFSPLYSLYNKIVILINQDKYIKDYYTGNKVPKSLIVANTGNMESFKSSLKEWKEKTRQDPHGVHPILHQKNPNETTSSVFEHINLMNNLNEMQYTQTREEIRRNVGALYGVSPVMMGDVSTSGGLNNEGLQIAVTDRAVEIGQELYNTKIIPFIFKQMGITDYCTKLIPTKEIDEVADLDKRIKELQVAKATAELGLGVRMNQEGDFVISEGDVELQTQAQEFIPFGNNEEGTINVNTPVEMSKSETFDLFKVEKEKPEEELAEDKKQSENALIRELEKIFNKLDRKRKPSEEEFNKIVNDAVKKIDSNLKKKSANRLKAVYQKTLKEMSKELNYDIKMTEKDKNIIDALKKEPVYNRAFADLSKNTSDRLKEVITQAYEDPKTFTINDIVSKMKEQIEKSDNELRTIARTETSKVSIAARKSSYDQTGARYKYKWIGPDDDRTTATSKAIKKRTSEGVEWNLLVRTIMEETFKSNPTWEINPLAPITHPNSRHTFIAERID